MGKCIVDFGGWAALVTGREGENYSLAL